MAHRENSRHVKPECPYFHRCGGCTFTGTSYGRELSTKEEWVYGLFDRYVKVDQIIAAPSKFGYRDKVHATFSTDRNGNIVSGLYARGSHHLISIKECRLEFREASEILQTIRDLMIQFHMRSYNEDSHKGDLRHVLLRKGHNSKEILLVMIYGNDRFRNKVGFAKELVKRCPYITTVLYQINNEQNSMILGSNRIVPIIGNGTIRDTICGLEFSISASSFFQVNAAQTEVLYSEAMDLAELTGKERVLDAYCGTGTIGLIASRRAGEVVGVEINPDAVRNAQENARINGIDNASFICGDASDYCKKCAKEKQTFDVAFLDPPRSGSDEKFLAALIRMNPKRIVYISCNPATQERDMRYLMRFGDYRPRVCQPVDMFPRTDHVETVVLLVKE